MSQKKVKKEYIILAAVIMILGVYLVFFSENDSINYQLPKQETLNAQDFTKIEISGAKGSVVLVQKDKKWVIDPQKYPTDETKIKEVTDSIANLTLTELATETKNYSRYGLEKDQRINVKAYSKDKIVRQFEVGKITATNNHTFVKLDGDDRVYHAKSAFRNYFEQKMDEFRDKSIMKLSVAEVSGISIEKDGTKLVFNKAAAPALQPGAKDAAPNPAQPTHPADSVWKSTDGNEGNKTQLDEILNQLVDLRCDEYITDKTKEDFTNPVYSITVKGQKDYTLTFYEKVKSGDSGDTEKYPVVCSENPYPFLMTTYVADQIMKKPEELLKKEGLPQQ